jgi:hypothetical protein
MTPCACSPQMVADLENLLHDGDGIRLLELIYELTNMGNCEGLLSKGDIEQLNMLNKLVASVAKKQRIDVRQMISS